MHRIVWLTDIHLNFVTAEDVDQLLEKIVAVAPDSVCISGDIGEAHDVVGYLTVFDEVLKRPIYFVLGNHDFYFGSIAEVRRRVAELCDSSEHLVYLSDCDAIELAPGVALVGHDGWADGRVGDYERSLVMMNDYRLIAELARVNKKDRWPLLMQYGDEAAAHIRRVLPPALDRCPDVFLMTHVPPLREACWYNGSISDDEWAPHFTCQAMGDAILEIMGEHPDNKLTVLCGHTHGSGQTRPLDNVLILTGGAEYRQPDITRVFELDGGAAR